MPSQSSLFDYPMYSFPRYTQGTFPSAPVQPANPLLTPAAGDSAFTARQSWPLDSHSTEYDSPNSTPYSEYGSPFEQEQYSSSVASQSVAYPESSQRTHVAGSAFTSLYTPRFYPSSNSSNITPSRSSHSPEDEPAAYRFPASPQHGASSHADSTARAHHDAWQDFPDSTASFDRLPSQSIPSYARNAMMPPLQSHSTALNNRAFLSTLPSPDQSGFSRLLTRESPRDAAFSFQSRPQGGDAFGEPGNPSAVPPLVYDGEEYDDESECSLPSAGPDIHRSGYPVSQSSGDDSASSTAATYSGMDDRSSSPSDSAGSSPRSAVEQQPTNTERTKSGTQKKSKMHQCTVCSKWFPRPSGLATHMNSHSGAKPYKCPIASCTKSFAVRSNAKRHLRTHGIFPSSDHAAAPAQFTVGFDAPIISDVHEVSKLPAKLRWVPQSLATRTNVDFLRDAPSDSEDEYPPSCPVLSVPLPAVVPSSPKWNDEDYEDRNSYEDMGPSPYLSAHQWRALPGPAIVNPPSL